MVDPKKGEVPKLNTLPKSFQDWEVGNNYEIIKQVGSGSYGYVVQSIQKSTGKKVAIKRLNKIFEDVIDCKRILREVCLLRMLQHPNLVHIIEILEPTDLKNFDSLYVVLEYAQSDLKKLFKSPIHLEMIHIQTLVYNILLGLKFIHSANVLHRDLKPANVLINEDCSVRVCDFGLARSVEGIVINPEKGDDDDDVDENAEKNVTTKPDKNREGTKKLTKQQGGLVKVKGMKRELTGHVVTRWYRAPELILLEKDYTAAIDVWSLGCIFAELLGMIKENAPTFLDRSPLFPGTSCFPLSPDRSNNVKRGGFPHSSQDQLSIIFSVLGTPSPDDFSFVTDAKAVDYLKSFPPKKCVEFSELFPAATPEALDLLKKMLIFNPHKRITIDECLNHPFLSKVRDKSKELVAPGPIILDFEKEGELSAERLRELFIAEIKQYKKK
jgi:mitogen-activated protein kinase 1/3